MHKRTETICGDSSIIPNFEEIGNNPNFVFNPDPNFEPVSLFNESGNTVSVNSWLECANYVNGGWTNYHSDFFNGESLYFIFVTGSFLLYIVKKRISFND
tara:strand:- start:4923 stop:5222 length:300 start_codon:yes stop_codon:yes gene_type:complete